MTNNVSTDIFTAPLSLGLRLGSPAVATPATTDLPWWNPKPPVPAPVPVNRTRRSFTQYVKDELPGLLIAGSTVVGVATVIAGYIS